MTIIFNVLVALPHFTVMSSGIYSPVFLSFLDTLLAYNTPFFTVTAPPLQYCRFEAFFIAVHAVKELTTVCITCGLCSPVQLTQFYQINRKSQNRYPPALSVTGFYASIVSCCEVGVTRRLRRGWRQYIRNEVINNAGDNERLRARA